jgi:hypothetical protein
VIKEGDIVIITSELPINTPFVGTFIGYLDDKKIQVLLSTGIIFTGNSYDVYLYEGDKNE